MNKARNKQVEKALKKDISKEEHELQHLEYEIGVIHITDTEEYIRAMEIIQKAAKHLAQI